MISTYGVEADERQRLDHYRAGNRAFQVLLGATLIAYVTSWFIGDDTIRLILGILLLVGINTYGLLIDASGWPEYVRQQIEERRDLRRRAWKRCTLGVLAAMTMLFAYHRFADGASPGKSALNAVTFGAVMMVFFWWTELRRRKRGDRPGDEPG